MAIDSISTLRLGTRGSALALTQAHLVKEQLRHFYPSLNVDIVEIKTSGDIKATEILADIGGKGLFIKEIEEHLLQKQVDIAVHSLKDMPAAIPSLLEIAAILPREDVRDVLVSSSGYSLEQLPLGTILGTSSPRRAAQILYQRPDIKIIPLRGNVPTRITKSTEANSVDCTLLAYAGIKRLNLFNPKTMSLLTTQKMLPAVGQGAIAIEIHKDNASIKKLLQPLNHLPSAVCVHAERIFLEHFETSSCRTPIAAHAYFTGTDTISFTALIAKPSGTQVLTASRHSTPHSINDAALDAALELRAQMGENFFDS